MNQAQLDAIKTLTAPYVQVPVHFDTYHSIDICTSVVDENGNDDLDCLPEAIRVTNIDEAYLDSGYLHYLSCDTGKLMSVPIHGVTEIVADLTFYDVSPGPLMDPNIPEDRTWIIHEDGSYMDITETSDSYEFSFRQFIINTLKRSYSYLQPDQYK